MISGTYSVTNRGTGDPYDTITSTMGNTCRICRIENSSTATCVYSRIRELERQEASGAVDYWAPPRPFRGLGFEHPGSHQRPRPNQVHRPAATWHRAVQCRREARGS